MLQGLMSLSVKIHLSMVNFLRLAESAYKPEASFTPR